MDAIRRAWRQKVDEFDRSKTSVDIGYDGLQTRLETIFTALQAKTIQMKDRCKELQKSIDSQRRSLNKARTAAEIRGTDESTEIQIELRLKMNAEELKARALQCRRQLSEVESHGAKYKSLYLKNVAKQRKIQSAEQAAQKIKDLEKERMLGMDLLKQRVKEEQDRIDIDIETIRKMRENLLHPPVPPQPKKSAREKYREMLKEAGQIFDDDDPQFSRCHDSDNREELVFEDIESDKEETEQQFGKEQIEFLENNVRTLLGTGNYTNDDPIIRRLRSQIADIIARQP
jgi:hypothetical protein